MHKTCRTCGKERPESAYEPDARYRGGYRHTCKECRQIAGRDRMFAAHIKRSYGLTQTEWTALFEEQGGCCAICKKPEAVLSRANQFGARKISTRLVVDHVHDDKSRVRGLLCRRCNIGIAQFDEDIDRLRAAIDYLISHSDKEVQPT